jgi:hypothetical protein
MVRPNVKIQSSNRELHEAIYLKELYQGQSIDPTSTITWVLVALGTAGFWYWLVNL